MVGTRRSRPAGFSSNQHQPAARPDDAGRGQAVQAGEVHLAARGGDLSPPGRSAAERAANAAAMADNGLCPMSDSEDELSSPAPRPRPQRPRRDAPVNIRVSLSPLSQESLNSSPSPSPRRAGAASAAKKREAAPEGCASASGDPNRSALCAARS